MWVIFFSGNTFTRPVHPEHCEKHYQILATGQFNIEDSTAVVRYTERKLTAEDKAAFPGMWASEFDKYQEATFGRPDNKLYAKYRDMVVEVVDFQHRTEAYRRFAIDHPTDPAACVFNKVIMLKPDTPTEVCRDIGFRINKDRDLNMVKNEESDQWKYASDLASQDPSSLVDNLEEVLKGHTSTGWYKLPLKYLTKILDSDNQNAIDMNPDLSAEQKTTQKAASLNTAKTYYQKVLSFFNPAHGKRWCHLGEGGSRKGGVRQGCCERFPPKEAAGRSGWMQCWTRQEEGRKGPASL